MGEAAFRAAACWDAAKLGKAERKTVSLQNYSPAGSSRLLNNSTNNAGQVHYEKFLIIIFSALRQSWSWRRVFPIELK